MSRLLATLALLTLAACATTGTDKNVAAVDPCDCGDEQQWDRPPPAPAKYMPETEDVPRETESDELQREGDE